MPQVVQIQRQPSSWEQGGQSIQQTADNFLKSMLAMGQMQGNNALHMATLNMQNQRLADANARDDKRWAEQQAAQERRFAQDDKWKAQELGIRRSELGLHQQALAEKNYGRDFIRSLLGGVNAGAQPNTGLDTAATAGMNEVLSPNWSPTSGGGQGGEQDSAPSMYDNGVKAGLISPVPSMVETAKRTGLFPQLSDSPTATQAETTPQAPQASMASPAQAQLPTDSGKTPMPSLPEKASVMLQGVPFTVDTFPPAFLAIPEGQRIFDGLKTKQEMLNHQYDLEMKAYNHENKQAGISDINNIGKRFTEESKPFQTMSDSMNRLVTGAMSNNAAGDMAMVYSYMKLLDPTSVVRESEYATAENARGVPDTVRNLYNKILEGTRLTPEQKTNFVNLGRQLWDGQSQMQDTRTGYFTNLAKGSGISPDLIVQDFSGPVKKSLSDYENWASGGASAMSKDADALINKARGLRK